MPDWLVFTFAGFMLIALGLVSWVLSQAFSNWRAIDEPGLRRYAWARFVREAFLWGTQAAATAVYLLVIVFPQPRSDLIRGLIVLLLLVVTLGVGLLSLHDFREMQETFTDAE